MRMALDAAIVRMHAPERLLDALRARGLEPLTTSLPGRLAPGQCVLITDSMKEFQMLQYFVTCVAVTSEAETFRAAGARAVYRDVDDLLAHLDQALTHASPGSARFTREMMNSLVRQALAVARDGMHAGEAPIGCVLARGDGSVIATGYNEQN